MPLNTFIARVLKNLQLQQMKSRDKRTKLMSELLNNIKRFALFFSSTTPELTVFTVSSYMRGIMPL
jgi:hypothetical protein